MKNTVTGEENENKLHFMTKSPPPSATPSQAPRPTIFQSHSGSSMSSIQTTQSRQGIVYTCSRARYLFLRVNRYIPDCRHHNAQSLFPDLSQEYIIELPTSIGRPRGPQCVNVAYRENKGSHKLTVCKTVALFSCNWLSNLLLEWGRLIYINA